MNATLIDVFTSGRLVTLWLRLEGGENIFLKDSITPLFYVFGEKEQLLEAKKSLDFFANDCEARLAQKLEFESNSFKEVLEVKITNVKKQLEIVLFLEKKFEYKLGFFNSDIELDRLYLFTKNIRPLQEVEFSASNGWANNLKPIAFNAFRENYPKLKTAVVQAIPTGNGEINESTKVYSMRLNDDYFHGEEQDVLKGFKIAFEALDPDVVLSMFGNKFEFELVKKRMHANGLEFNFGRFQDEFRQKEGKSYFSYGRVVRHEPARYLKGRLHIQINDFHFNECGLDGIYEIAHSTVMPIQKAARLGSGNCISNLQFYVAFQKGFIIPSKKNQVERFNSAWHLFEADKGGMVYEPITGLHENVIELDFSSLYPSIMVYHNISPETVLCDCCNEKKVPGIGYNICEKRRGIIPEVLEPLLKKRLYYKHMKEITRGKEKEKYKAMSNALKWLLVVSFGYTGFKNARFGRIEAHQSICAFAREKLLQAAHLAEASGFEIVHGIVDAIYIKKNGHTAQEIQELVNKITEQTGVEIVVEGTFKWVVFLPRMENHNIATPTRFYGAYTNNEIKARGIQMRRSDAPTAIKRMQEQQIQVLATALNEREFKQKTPEALKILGEWIQKLENNLIPPEELAIRLDVTKKPEEYHANVPQKAALIQLKQKGIKVSEGEPIHFIYSNFKAKKFEQRIQALPNQKPRIDTQKYSELFIRATYELLNFTKKDKKTLELATKNTIQTKMLDWIAIKTTAQAKA